VRGADVAADLMSETFAAALASRATFRPQGEFAAVGWLFGIARYTLSGSVRRGRVEDRARRRMSIARPVLEDERLEAVDELVSTAGLLAALEELPPDQREAVRAHVLEEDDYAVIAARLECSPAVVRKRVSRGLARLRRSMEESR
jgi:RNA polymerase sigma-70 factor (ECF subfamily)